MSSQKFESNINRNKDQTGLPSIEELRKQKGQLPPPSQDDKPPLDNPVGLIVGTTKIEEQMPIKTETTIQENNSSIDPIDEKIDLLPPPQSLQCRLKYKRRHIINVITAELQDCADIHGTNISMYGHLGLELLEELHDRCPDFRDRLRQIKRIAASLPKDAKEEFAKEQIKQILLEQLK
jgi:hypothetical protein